MTFRFHPLAIEQQEEIWFYTFRAWGEEQADRYLADLHHFLEKLPESLKSPRIKRVAVEGDLPVFMVRHAHHYIFFRTARDPAIQERLVLSILHEKMDLPRRLSQTLARLKDFEP